MGDVIKKGSTFIYPTPKRGKAGGLIGPLSPGERREKAFSIRVKAAKYWKRRPLPKHPSNGDERRYPDKIASYTKGLPHNRLGEVDRGAYDAMIRALKSGKPREFANLPLAGAVRLTNPQAAYSLELVGPDSHQLTLPPPSFSSAEVAAELAELYWYALARDIPYAHYDTSPLIAAAANELTAMSDFRGPKIRGRVTPDTLFREKLEGGLVGPRVSQFLWMDIPFVSTRIVQRYRTPVPGDDHLTAYDDWLDVQNGALPPTTSTYDPTPRYIRNGRDLAEWVGFDRPMDAGEIACRILLAYGEEAWDPANPYLHSDTQIGFVTFGSAHALDFITRAARPALESAWFQKWLVHRRLRPEEYGGRIQNRKTGAASYPIHSEILESEALARTFERYGTYLLPQAYPGGCPTHPSYLSGHSTYIGAMVTMLKAFFDESFVIPNPVVASADGLMLLPYEGPPLTVGGELNKLASNIGNGRIAAGIHFRSSNLTGLELGQSIAIGILRDYKATYNETFKGFTLTQFDGTTITI